MRLPRSPGIDRKNTMGQPDRTSAAPSEEAATQIELDFDAYRLLNSCNAVSKACEQTKLDLDAYRSSSFSSKHPNASRPDHNLVPLPAVEPTSAPAGGLLERRVLPAFPEHANPTGSPRFVHPWQLVQNQAPIQRN